jgi:NADH-quinone oxidoreductase subunit H
MDCTCGLFSSVFSLLVFPGFLFLSAYGTFAEWVDRILYARMQNRVGPPIFQPVADFIKLMAKEVIIPDAADKGLFRILPVIAVASTCTAMLMVPVWRPDAVVGFQGDLVAALYLLTIPTATFFLAGWCSSSPYATVGSVRALTQLFAYEVPLFLAVVGPAILAGSLSIRDIAAAFTANPLLILVNLPGLAIALLALQGKLERVPFDIPHAETEVVGGPFTEYSGGLLALFLLATDMEMVVGAALVSAVFLGGSLGLPGLLGFAAFLAKTLAVVFVLSLTRALMARIRIEQMIGLCWKILAPVALLQILADVLIRKVI